MCLVPCTQACTKDIFSRDGMKEALFMRHLILVTSPPASGKTFVSKQLAKALTNCVYLDKDTLIVLSKQIFKVAGEEYNRSSDFFEREIRDYEYDCVLELAMEALEYNDTVLINAPFTSEIRDDEFLTSLRGSISKIRCRVRCHLGEYEDRSM